MFNRKFLLFASVTLLVLIAVGALIWFVGSRLGWGPMALERGLHPGLRPEIHGFWGMRPWAFGRMPFGFGGILAAGLLRFLGWLLQVSLIVAIVMWLLRRNAPPTPSAQPIASAPPSEPSNPPQA